MTQFEHNLLATFLGMITGFLIHKFFPVPGESEYWNDLFGNPK